MDDEEILHRMEGEWIARRAEVRKLIADAGRPDVLAQYDQNMRDIDTGIAGARSTWHSISPAQRRALTALVNGDGKMQRRNGDSPIYDGNLYGGRFYGPICRLPTVRNLIARELLACEGGAFDPECAVSITERGRFVVEHGPSPVRQ